MAKILTMTRTTGPLAVPRIEYRIHLVRGERVIIDADLAELYGVPTKRLNEQARRNAARFPEDFMPYVPVQRELRTFAA